jgi:hypothetical protein
VGEPGTFPRLETIPPTRSTQPVLPPDPSKHQNDPHRAQQRQLGLQVRPALLQLDAGRTVVRRGTPRRSRDVAIAQQHAIIPALGSGTIGPAMLVQRAVQPLPACVSREDTAGAIATMRTWGKTYDQEPRPRVAESRYRPSPVLMACVLPFTLARNIEAVVAKPRATLAANDGLCQRGQGYRKRVRVTQSGSRRRMRSLLSGALGSICAKMVSSSPSSGVQDDGTRPRTSMVTPD